MRMQVHWRDSTEKYAAGLCEWEGKEEEKVFFDRRTISLDFDSSWQLTHYIHLDGKPVRESNGRQYFSTKKEYILFID